MALRDSLRPRTLDEIVGQEKAKLAVKGLLASNTPEHLLLAGPVGTGKTSMATILARAFTGKEQEGVAEFGAPAWFHLNSAQCGNKDFVQEIVQKVACFDVLKIFVFDEAHAITRLSQDLLLNALEKQDGKTFYFFCTTKPMKLSHALRSRCRKVFFEELGPEDRAKLCERGRKKLSLKCLPAGFIDELNRKSLGGARSILNALESAALGVPVKDAVKLEMPDRPYHFRQDISSALRRYDQLKAQRLCIDCGKRKPLKGRTQCGPCVKDTTQRRVLREKKAGQAQAMAAGLPGQRLFAIA